MKRGLAYFIVELIIVTLGVSVSLLMNDYREDRKEKEQEEKILRVILSNLEMDSLNCERHQYVLKLFGESIEKLIYLKSEIPLDSFNTYLDHAASYSKLETVDIGFRELNNSGIKLENDSLYRELLTYYTTLTTFIAEWNKVDSEFITQDVIPFIINNFPKLVLTEGPVSGFALAELPALEKLQNTKFRNLLVTDRMYKKNLMTVSSSYEQTLHDLLKNTRAELKRLETN